MSAEHWHPEPPIFFGCCKIIHLCCFDTAFSSRIGFWRLAVGGGQNNFWIVCVRLLGVRFRLPDVRWGHADGSSFVEASGLDRASNKS